MTPQLTIVTVTLTDREDGGLRVYSDDLPGLILSGSDRHEVVRKIVPAIQALFEYKGFKQVTVRQQHRCRRVAASVVLAAHAAAWRRVSCWSHAAARWPVVAGARPAPARRRSAAPPASPDRHQTNDRRRPPRGGRPLPHRTPHRRLAQLAHPAGRSRMLIALHRLAPVKASDAISHLNAVV